MIERTPPQDRAWLREALILGAFLAVCALSVWLVVLPELSDHDREADPAGGSAVDAGMP